MAAIPGAAECKWQAGGLRARYELQMSMLELGLRGCRGSAVTGEVRQPEMFFMVAIVTGAGFCRVAYDSKECMRSSMLLVRCKAVAMACS